MKSKNSSEGGDSDEEEVDEFDRGTGSRGRRQDSEEDEDYPDSDESESDDDEDDEGEDEEGDSHGDGEEDDEFDLDIDGHMMDAETGSEMETKDMADGTSEEARQDPEHNLLLLPSPRNYSLASLKDFYTPVFTTAFQRAPQDNPSSLDIAIHVPFLSKKIHREGSFGKTQQLLARLYSILNTVAATQERGFLVDARIVFLSDIGEAQADDSQTGIGPIIGLRELAGCGRKWKSILVASSSLDPPAATEEAEASETSEGEAIVKAFSELCGDRVDADAVSRCALGALNDGETPEVEDTQESSSDASTEHFIVAGEPPSPLVP